MDRISNVYPLYAAAALTRIENCAIDYLICCPLDINISSDVCWILAAKLKSNVNYTIGRSSLYL